MGDFLATLRDVNLAGLADGAGIYWDATTKQWKAAARPWTAYTPTWQLSATGAVQPSLGNGNIVGRYKQTEKTVDLYIALTFGSTTSLGSGTGSPIYHLSFPAGLSPVTVPVGAAVLNGPSGNALGIVYWDGDTNGLSALVQENTQTYQWNQNTPLQVATAHMSFSIRYETP